MAVDPKVLLRIQTLIADAHNAFIVNFIGPDAVPPEVLARLRRMGKVRPQARAVADAYMVGRLQATLSGAAPPKVGGSGAGSKPPQASIYVGGKPAVRQDGPRTVLGDEMDDGVGAKRPQGSRNVNTKPTTDNSRSDVPEEKQTTGETEPKAPAPAGTPYVGGKPSTGQPVPKTAQGEEMGYEQVRAHLEKNPIPLSQAERDGIHLNEVRAASYVRGLGNRVEAQTGALLIAADAQQEAAFKQTITDEVSRNIAQRKTIRQLRSDLGHATGDWARDLDRIALTEKHTALQAGVAAGLMDKTGPEGDVSVVTSVDCCRYCAEAYKEPDGRPKIFKMGELLAAGSNVGRKAAERKAVTPPFHPNCFPAGTLIRTARGPVPIEAVTTCDQVLTHRGRWRRVTQLHCNIYKGALHRIAGVAMTADHPVFTSSGWLPAQGIQEGTGLLRCVGQIATTESSNYPAALQEKGRFWGILRHLLWRCVPVAGIDLDGQPCLAATKIDIIGAHGQLWGQSESVVTKEFFEELFQRAQASSALSAACSLLQDLFGVALPPSGGLGCADVEKTLLRRKTAVPYAGSLFVGARDQSIQGHVSDDSGPGHIHLGGDGQNAEIFDEMEPVQGLFSKMAVLPHFRPVPHRSSTVNAFCGPVYNLTVWEDESYFAGDLAVHNCSCALTPVPKGLEINAQGKLQRRTPSRPIRKSLSCNVSLRLGRPPKALRPPS